MDSLPWIPGAPHLLPEPPGHALDLAFRVGVLSPVAHVKHFQLLPLLLLPITVNLIGSTHLPDDVADWCLIIVP